MDHQKPETATPKTYPWDEEILGWFPTRFTLSDGASLVLVTFPYNDGITINISYGVDVFKLTSLAHHFYLLTWLKPNLNHYINKNWIREMSPSSKYAQCYRIQKQVNKVTNLAKSNHEASLSAAANTRVVLVPEQIQV